MDRDVPGLVLVLEMVEHGQPRLIGQADIEHDGAGLVVPRDIDRLLRRPCDDALEAHFVRQVAHDRGKGRIVLDHQQQPLAGFQRIAIVFDPAVAGAWQQTRLGAVRALASGGLANCVRRPQARRTASLFAHRHLAGS